MLERLFIKKYISEKVLYKLTSKLVEINKMINSWINKYECSDIILTYFKLENLKYVNKIYIDNLEIEKIENFDNNQYKIYKEKSILISIIERIKSYEKENCYNFNSYN